MRHLAATNCTARSNRPHPPSTFTVVRGTAPAETAEEDRVETRDRIAEIEKLFAISDVGENWQERALCREVDNDIFFPEQRASSAPAKRICSLCSVRAECLEFALAHDEHHGIWGGLAERQRRALRMRTNSNLERLS